MRGCATTINRLVVEWAGHWGPRIDPVRGFVLARDEFSETLRRELNLVIHIVDLQEHTIIVRPPPGSKFQAPSYRSSRGEKVEIGHAQLKHFANLGMRPKLFQALTMEGIVRDNADRREAAKRFVDDDGDTSSMKITTAPRHHRPWLRRERNVLADEAGFQIPYPDDGFKPPEDNGERFLMEYAYQQAKRRRSNGGEAYTSEQIREAEGCPCQECLDKHRSLVAGGGGGGGGGGGEVSLYPQPTRVFRRGRVAAIPPPPAPQLAPYGPPPPPCDPRPQEAGVRGPCLNGRRAAAAARPRAPGSGGAIAIAARRIAAAARPAAAAAAGRPWAPGAGGAIAIAATRRIGAGPGASGPWYGAIPAIPPRRPAGRGARALATPGAAPATAPAPAPARTCGQEVPRPARVHVRFSGGDTRIETEEGGHGPRRPGGEVPKQLPFASLERLTAPIQEREGPGVVATRFKAA